MMSENRASIRQGLLPDKICSTHRDRLAIVYIRQSTPQQIERHQESTRLQYALVERAVHFGWPRERVVVIDDDLGRTGKTIEGRLGFQRLVAEVSLGNVGLVLGIEMSRLARSYAGTGTSSSRSAPCSTRSSPIPKRCMIPAAVITTGSCWA